MQDVFAITRPSKNMLIYSVTCKRTILPNS